MAVTDSTYYALTRVREASPEAQNWAATDLNWDIISKILKTFEQHRHTGTQGLKYPGFKPLDIENPDLATLTENSLDGFLSPGTSVGVRLAYVDSAGLETEASPEILINLAPAIDRPLTPQLADGWPKSITAEGTGDLAGGSYIYGMTKCRGSGETLISDLLPVDVPYDDTYQVKITFDPISDYIALHEVGDATSGSPVIQNILNENISVGMSVTEAAIPVGTTVIAIDPNASTITLSQNAGQTGTLNMLFSDGTESLNIYRAEGLDSEFILVDKITDPDTTSYIDTGEYEPSLIGVQPPQTSTFDTTKSVTIDWSSITVPGEAKKLRIYVTQEAYLWSEVNLLAELDFTTYLDTSFTYLGSEDLQEGWPKNSSQVIDAPPKINLANEVTGALTLDADMNFANHLASNMKLGIAPATKEPGMIWYDSASSGQLIMRGQSSDLVLAQAGAGYTHPTEEGGGHVSSNIRHHSGSATPSVKTVLDYVSDPTTGNRKQVQPVVHVEGQGGTIYTNSTTFTTVAAPGGGNPMWAVPITPSFSNQWLRITWDGEFLLFSDGNTVYNPAFDIQIIGTGVNLTNDNWIRSTGISYGGFSIGGEVFVQLSNTSDVYSVLLRWKTDPNTVLYAWLNRRRLTAQLIF